VEQRLELLQRLSGLDRQAALGRFLHSHHCFAYSESSLEQKVARLQQMLAGRALTAGQLVAGMPTLLGARLAGRHASRLPDACMLLLSPALIGASPGFSLLPPCTMMDWRLPRRP
jgi:hypothetical protein